MPRRTHRPNRSKRRPNPNSTTTYYIGAPENWDSVALDLVSRGLASTAILDFGYPSDKKLEN